MVSPTNTQPEAETTISNGALVKPSNATVKRGSSLPDQPPLKSVNTSIKNSGNVVMKNSEMKQSTNVAIVTMTDTIIEADTNDETNDNKYEQVSLSAESQPSTKLPIPAPIPPVNYWEMRKQQNAKRVPKDQSSWPAPAEVLIKDKEKEANENSERKQSEKWIPYVLPITHSTPPPNHGQKHRRRSEDSVPHTGTRERRTNVEKPFNSNAESAETSTMTATASPSGSSLQQNGNSNPRRRASVPPPNGREQYSRRYSQSAADNGQLGHHMNNGSFRGGRRGGGRSRPFNGTRAPPRSTTYSYSAGFPQQYGNLFTAKMPPYLYDIEILKYYILQQVEYYFSIENLCKDLFLRSNMDVYGFVDISLLANFNRVKLLTLDENLVREALLHSYVVEVSGDKARKREGWEMWILPNQSQQNRNEDTLAESTYNYDSSIIEEYDNELNESSNSTSTITTTSTYTHNITLENFEPLTATASR
ncbi:9806_t:CDS:10 [Ambispora gerdemannii]|uniref:9806_t:CDS:1 n=1 Tax=Ambispora gerdemannii TaxID=144530 RepID=A0A9N9AUV8_9GLOM|nr:9806_t:CDS:10 [Ambispora gerdemannii]